MSDGSSEQPQWIWDRTCHVACPTCEAPPMSVCIGTQDDVIANNGRVYRCPHRDRVWRAAVAWDEGRLYPPPQLQESVS